MRFLLVVVMILGVMVSAQARPVSYPGGWTLMQMNDGSANTLHVHYSPTARYSVGYKGKYSREKQWQFHGVQLNHLIKRVNGRDSQGNIYLKSAVGAAYSEEGAFDGDIKASGSLGLAADWETRRFFISYENEAYYAGEIESGFIHKARVGVAPYIGDYGDVHTWFMVQLDHAPTAEDATVVTPLVRLFKEANLWEFGVNNNGKVLVNFIHRF